MSEESAAALAAQTAIQADGAVAGVTAPMGTEDVAADHAAEDAGARRGPMP